MGNWARPKRFENLGVFLLADIIGKIQGGCGFGIYPMPNEAFGNVDKAPPCARKINERLVIAAIHILRIEDAFAQMLFYERDCRTANRIAERENALLEKNGAVESLGLERRIHRSLDEQQGIILDSPVFANFIVIRKRNRHILARISVNYLERLGKKAGLIPIILMR